MANTATNVSVGKPKITGGIWRAPIGTTLPTDAVTALDAAFVTVGYVSSDGVTNNNGLSTDSLRAWGGDVVLIYQTETTDTFAFNLLEVLNPDALKVPFGDDNVTGTLTTGITLRANAADKGEHVYVIDMILRDGALKRIVIPDGKVSEIGEVTYKDDEAIAYPVTITAQAGTDGDTHKEYIIRP